MTVATASGASLGSPEIVVPLESWVISSLAAGSVRSEALEIFWMRAGMVNKPSLGQAKTIR